MKGYIKQLLREGLFDSIDWGNEPEKPIKHTEYGHEYIIITLYRGVNDKNELIDNRNGTYTLKNEHEGRDNNFIWFSRNKQFTEGYASHALITYPLKVANHFKLITYADGTTKKETLFINKVKSAYDGRGEIEDNTTEDWPKYGNIELPDNWYFSYKTQKHIVCGTDLIIPKINVKIT